MPGVRFALPAVVLLLFGAGLSPPAGRGPALACTGLLLAASAWQFVGLLGTSFRPSFTPHLGARAGLLFEDDLPPGATIAVSAAGATPYYAPSHSFIDTLGINDRTIARRKLDSLTTLGQWTPGHRKGDGAYVLARQPDVIVLGPVYGYRGEYPNLYFLTDRELIDSPEFRRSYAPYRFPLPRAGDQVTPPSARDEVIPTRRLIAWLRVDSERAAKLAVRGAKMEPPW
jgi:hypothetical protein